MDESIKTEAGLLHENICQALADPKRIVILYVLADRPHNVTDIATELGAPQPTVSRHLKILRDRSLVTAERDGNQVVYSLRDRRVIEALDLMRAMVVDLLRDRGRLVETIARTTSACDVASDSLRVGSEASTSV